MNSFSSLSIMCEHAPGMPRHNSFTRRCLALDPERAGKFMFATPTGQIVRCEIDARVGGSFAIVDRRAGEDFVHAGTFEALERPRLIVFTFSVLKYSSERSTVRIEIAPPSKGWELTLTHEMKAQDAPYRDRTEEGWRALALLRVAAERDEQMLASVKKCRGRAP